MAIIQALSSSRLILLLKRGVKSRLIIDISFNLFIESDIEKSYRFTGNYCTIRNSVLPFHYRENNPNGFLYRTSN